MNIIFGVVGLAIGINKALDYLKDVMPEKFLKHLIPISWVVGMLFAFVFSLSPDIAKNVEVGETTLGQLDLVGVLIFGFFAGAGASVLNDLKPNRLSDEQVERAVKQADTVVLEGTAVPAPVASSAKRTTRRSTPGKK